MFLSFDWGSQSIAQFNFQRPFSLREEELNSDFFKELSQATFKKSFELFKNSVSTSLSAFADRVALSGRKNMDIPFSGTSGFFSSYVIP